MKLRILIPVAGAWLMLASCGPKKNTLTGDESHFKVEDTASVDMIFLADKSNRTVLLTRENGTWMVNHEFQARKDMIQNLMICIRRVEVKEFVPKAAIENQIKALSVGATKVEIYQNKKLAKVYYVGGPTQDHLGTYMIMQDSNTPFVCYMPGFRGYLSNYYIPMVEEWRDRVIFSYNIKDIASVRVDFARDPDASWELTNVDNASFRLKSVSSGQYLEGFDTSRVKDVLRNFKVMGFEAFATVNKARMDSVQAKYGLYTVSVTDRNGKTRFVQLYEIPLQPGTLDMLGNPVSIDMDRMYGIVDGKTTTICQYYTFDPVTVPIGFFMPAPKGR